MTPRRGNPKYSDADVTTDPLTGCKVRPGCRHKNGYVKRTVDKKLVYAHVAAWEQAYGPVPEGFEVDHECRNRACENIDHLRLATDSQQQGNRVGNRNAASRFKGVFASKKGKPWMARIGGRHIGMFATEEEAAHAYDAEAVAKWGEFALTNFGRRGIYEPAG